MTIAEFLDKVHELSKEVPGLKKDDDEDVRFFIVCIDVDNSEFGIAGNSCPKCISQWILSNPIIQHDADEGEIIH